MTTLDERRIAPGATTVPPGRTSPLPDYTWAAPQRPGVNMTFTSGTEPQPLPFWAKHLQVELSDLVALPRGWDGHTARPVTQHALKTLLTVLSSVMDDFVARPQVFPLADGGLSAEWRAGQFEIEIEVEGAGSAWVAAKTPEGVALDQELIMIRSALTPDEVLSVGQTIVDLGNLLHRVTAHLRAVHSAR